jgi:hypothetical protein
MSLPPARSRADDRFWEARQLSGMAATGWFAEMQVGESSLKRWPRDSEDAEAKKSY